MQEQNDDLKKLRARMDKIDEKQKQLSAQKRAIRSRFAQKERKARTKRLIEKGALLEKLLDDHGEPAQTEKTLQQLLNSEIRYQKLKKFTESVTFEDKSTVFQRFLQAVNKQSTNS